MLFVFELSVLNLIRIAPIMVLKDLNMFADYAAVGSQQQPKVIFLVQWIFNYC